MRKGGWAFVLRDRKKWKRVLLFDTRYKGERRLQVIPVTFILFSCLLCIILNDSNIVFCLLVLNGVR